MEEYSDMIFIIICFINSATANLSDVETLRNITTCDISTNVDLTCVGDEMIAVQSLQYAYDVRCESTCCNTYTSTDCFEYAAEADIEAMRRTCSGHTTCSLSTFQDKRSFCAYGVRDTSYIFLQYFCIPKTRVTSICSTDIKLMSENLPLYITNENYPSVTTGRVTCSCSIETYSCTAGIHIYTLDADLYLDESHCDQSLKFVDRSNNTVNEINCESHFKNEIKVTTISKHYIRLDFINNSTADQEGYFFIGFDSTEAVAPFSLNCGAEDETWCTDCGTLPPITDGTLALNDATNSSYGATAVVICNTGYEAITSTIACLANGTWSAASCSQTAIPANCSVNEQRCDNGDCIPDNGSCATGSIPNGVPSSTVTTTPVQQDKDLPAYVIVVIVVAVIFLLQLLAAVILYKAGKNHSSGHSITKISAVLCCIPIFGICVICYHTMKMVCINKSTGPVQEDIQNKHYLSGHENSQD